MNYSFYGMVQRVKHIVLNTDNNVVLAVASIIAAIFACFAIVSITKNIVSGDQFSIWKIARPIVILAIMPFFNSIVLALDGIMTSAGDAIWVGVAYDYGSYDAKYAALVAKVESLCGGQIDNESIGSYSTSESIEGMWMENSNISGEALADVMTNGSHKEKAWYEKLWDTLTGWVSDAENMAIELVGNVLSFIFSFAMNCVRYCLVGASGVYLMVLGIIGPLVLAISLIPSFENAISQWIARYIQVALWVPLTSIVDFVNCKMRVAMVDTFEQCSWETMMTFPIHQLLMNIIALGMLFAVPSMASWIIQSTGMANVYRGVVSRASYLATKVIMKK